MYLLSVFLLCPYDDENKTKGIIIPVHFHCHLENATLYPSFFLTTAVVVWGENDHDAICFKIFCFPPFLSKFKVHDIKTSLSDFNFWSAYSKNIFETSSKFRWGSYILITRNYRLSVVHILFRLRLAAPSFSTCAAVLWRHTIVILRPYLEIFVQKLLCQFFTLMLTILVHILKIPQ